MGFCVSTTEPGDKPLVLRELGSTILAELNQLDGYPTRLGIPIKAFGVVCFGRVSSHLQNPLQGCRIPKQLVDLRIFVGGMINSLVGWWVLILCWNLRILRRGLGKLWEVAHGASLRGARRAPPLLSRPWRFSFALVRALPCGPQWAQVVLPLA